MTIIYHHKTVSKIACSKLHKNVPPYGNNDLTIALSIPAERLNTVSKYVFYVELDASSTII